MSTVAPSLPATVISGLILAGGRAERMGGIDKGLIPYLNRPLIETALARLQGQVSQLMINANRNRSNYEGYGYPVIADDHLVKATKPSAANNAAASQPAYFGPLAGFSIGLQHCETEYLLTVPCDSPLFPLDLGARLSTELLRGQYDLVYARSVDSSGQVWNQAVFCLMKKNLRASLEQFLASGARKIDRWFKLVNSSSVLFENDLAFANANTPEELAHLEALAQLVAPNQRQPSVK
ncbi:MAG: molybdenum cofactor guanylyltransferase [Polynucleobacter sp.]|nr:molybdenum cofactor guanylyltransferase [Polynucleobacter sp.]